MKTDETITVDDRCSTIRKNLPLDDPRMYLPLGDPHRLIMLGGEFVEQGGPNEPTHLA